MCTPRGLDEKLLINLFDRKQTNTGEWAPMPFFNYVQHTPVNNITEIAHPLGHPVLVENYVNPPSEKYILDKLIKKNKGRPIRVTGLFFENVYCAQYAYS